jgi:DNA transposition AAA+ family ATPase
MSTLISPHRPSRFVDITASKQVRSAVEAALDLEYPSLVTGEPGTGKTTALLRHAADFRGIYCQVGQASKSVKGMYQMLLDAHGMWTDAKFLTELADIVYRRLDGPPETRGQLLVVDEIQTLDLAALRELLNIQETCRIPLVLCGNDERLARTKSHDSALEQVKSRIGIRVKLGKPLPEDCRDIAVEFNVEGKDAYAALETFGCQTSLRDLVHVLEIASVVTGGVGSIQLRHIEQAALKKYDDRNTLKLFFNGDLNMPAVRVHHH